MPKESIAFGNIHLKENGFAVKTSLSESRSFFTEGFDFPCTFRSIKADKAHSFFFSGFKTHSDGIAVRYTDYLADTVFTATKTA